MIGDMTNKICSFMRWDYWIGSGGSYYTSGDIYGDFITHNPLTDWNDWKLVENRIREKDLWDKYCWSLGRELPLLTVCHSAYAFGVVLQATIEQRAEALMRVLEDTDGMVS